MTRLVDSILKFIEESDITNLNCEEGFTYTKYYVSLKKRKFFSKKLYASLFVNSNCLVSLKLGSVDLANSLCPKDSEEISSCLEDKIKAKEKLDAEMLEKRLIKMFS